MAETRLEKERSFLCFNLCTKCVRPRIYLHRAAESTFFPPAWQPSPTGQPPSSVRSLSPRDETSSQACWCHGKT